MYWGKAKPDVMGNRRSLTEKGRWREGRRERSKYRYYKQDKEKWEGRVVCIITTIEIKT